MTVADVHCPACDAAIVDVASSYEFHRSETTQVQRLHATCANGHALDVGWTPERFMVEVQRPATILTAAEASRGRLVYGGGIP